MFGSYNTTKPKKSNHLPISSSNNNDPKDKTTNLFNVNDYFTRNSHHHESLVSYSTHSVNPRGKKTVSTPRTKKILLQIESYCDKTTLHGLRYVGDPSLSLCERLFWFVAFGIAACLAGYYISNIYIKWDQSPVIISFSPFDADLNSIPFPSITICNMNQAKRYEAEKIIEYGPPDQKKLLYDYCNLNEEPNQTEYETNWDTMKTFLINVGQSCSDMLRQCNWKSEKVDCEEFFNNDLTDEGLCCSFNRLPPNNIYWNPKSLSYLNQTFTNFVYDWNPEDGFQDKITEENVNYIPRRPLGSGVHLGLSIVLDAQVDNYYCSSTNSIGFKIMLSNPIETPRTADYGFLLSPGVEARYVINPVIREATPSLRNVPIEKRQCYFSNERRLQYYRSYTPSNCNQECKSNYTFELCGCIPYYLPQGRGCRTCVKRDMPCVKQAQEDTEIVSGKSKHCECLPGCAEISYTKASSTSKIYSLPSWALDEKISLRSFKKNFAIVHFFFYTTNYRKERKSEIYGFSDFLSNTGGLLGMFLGFSILSVVEIIYHILIRSICKTVKKRHNARLKAKTQISKVVTYTERNCRLECMSNYTLEKCKCIPYYLPKDATIKICGKKDVVCQNNAKETMELSYKKSGSSCTCLPGCFEITYTKTGTYSFIDKEYYLNRSEEQKIHFRKNTAIAHFFFYSAQFSKQVKSEVFGINEFISSCGGLLGLFMGFSVLSLIELFYFITLRVMCKNLRRHKPAILISYPFTQ